MSDASSTRGEIGGREISVGRRRFIGLTGGAVASALLGCASSGPDRLQPLLRLAERGNEGLERGLFRHRAEDRIPNGARLTGASFPKYFISEHVPMWDEATRGVWRLEVSGAVRKPLLLTVDDLLALPRTRQRVDHFCVEGWTARAEWMGTRVSDLARAAGLTADAQYVDFQSFDSGYHESWDLESAMHSQTLVAYAMDGRFLGAGHGAPARVHSPVKLGYKNTKYLTKVVFLPARNGGYWSDRGYEWYGGT